MISFDIHVTNFDINFTKQYFDYKIGNTSVSYVRDVFWQSFCGPAGWSVIQYPIGWLDEILLWAGELLIISAVSWWASWRPEPEQLVQTSLPGYKTTSGYNQLESSIALFGNEKTSLGKNSYAHYTGF